VLSIAEVNFKSIQISSFHMTGDKTTCEQAALNGHSHVLKWAHKNGCDWDEDTFVNAAEGGHVHICKCIHNNTVHIQYH
jgi:hypothetical protein